MKALRNIKLIRPANKPSFKFISLIMILTLIPSLSNAKNILEQYVAEYYIHYYNIKVGTSTHIITKKPDNSYIAETHSVPSFKIIPFEEHEKSTYKIVNNKIKPLVHEYNYKKKGTKKSGTLKFNWNENIAVDNGNAFHIHDRTHDPITYAIQLRNDLRDSKTDLSYSVLKDSEFKNYVFAISGRELLQTKIGPLKTVRVKHTAQNGQRTTTIWLAEDLDYLMVKLEQTKKGKVYAKAEIFSFDEPSS